MERLELIRNVCRDEALRNLSHTVVSKFVLDRIFVCDKHKILFCQTPKVGNTQWKKVLIVLNGAVWCGAVGLLDSGQWGAGSLPSCEQGPCWNRVLQGASLSAGTPISPGLPISHHFCSLTHCVGSSQYASLLANQGSAPRTPWRVLLGGLGSPLSLKVSCACA